MAPTANDIFTELVFTTSRSSGPGGQNVNKVNSKVTLLFNIEASSILSREQKDLLLTKLQARISKDGTLSLSSQEKRSQLENKENVIVKLNGLLVKAFAKQKARRATKPGKAVKAKRLDAKKRRSQKKQWRRRDDI